VIPGSSEAAPCAPMYRPFHYKPSPGSVVGFAMKRHLPLYSLCAKNGGKRAFRIASAVP
jgi:hypothetical protein